MFQVEVDQQRSLKEQAVSFQEGTGPGDLAAVHFDIVAGSEFGLQAQGLQSLGNRLTDGPGYPGQIGPAGQGLPGTDQFPAQLAFIEVDRPASGYPPVDLNAAGPAVVGPNLLRDGLVVADQRHRGGKPQIAQGIRYHSPAAGRQQGFIPGHVFRPA